MPRNALQPGARRLVDLHVLRLGAHRFFEPGRRLAGRRGQCDERCGAPRRRPPARRAAPGRGRPWWSCPVPGPPAITERRRSTAVAAATGWSGRGPRRQGPLGTASPVPAPRGPRRPPGPSRRPAATGPAATATSSSQRRSSRGWGPRDAAGDRHRPGCSPRAPQPLVGFGPRQRVEVDVAVAVAARRVPDRSPGRRTRGPAAGRERRRRRQLRWLRRSMPPSRSGTRATWTSDGGTGCRPR